jgi:hypothetical protein
MTIEIQLQKKKFQMIKMAIELDCHFDRFFQISWVGI